MNLSVVYYGTVEVNIKDPAIVQNYGGIEKVRASIEKETCILTDNNVQFRFGGRDYRMVSRLSESSQSIANMIIEQSRDIWPREYGVELIGIVYGNFALTEGSRETYDKLRIRRFPNSPNSRKHRQRPPHGNALIVARRTRANSVPTAAQSRGNNL